MKITHEQRCSFQRKQFVQRIVAFNTSRMLKSNALTFQTFVQLLFILFQSMLSNICRIYILTDHTLPPDNGGNWINRFVANKCSFSAYQYYQLWNQCSEGNIGIQILGVRRILNRMLFELVLNLVLPKSALKSSIIINIT